MSREAFITLVVILVAIGLAVGITLIVRRQLWKKKIRELGWEHDASPTLQLAMRLGNPPFDCGFERKIDESIHGTTTSGLSFQVFEYEYERGAGSFSSRVGMIHLPFPLPQLYVTAHTPNGPARRSGVIAPPVQVEPQFDAAFQLQAFDAVYAAAVVSAPVRAAIANLAAVAPIDLSIDHDSLVSTGLPKDPDELKAYLDQLAAVAQAINADALESYKIPAKQPRLGFHGQDWSLIDSDDRLIGMFHGVEPFGQGHGQRTSDVLTGTASGVPMVAFNYHWKTRHTRTVSDGKGGTRTETYTKDHEKPIMALTMPVQLPDLSIGPDSMLGRLFGGTIDFESHDFNAVFDVNSAIPKFAHDVVHPRMMEFLLAARPPQLIMHNNLLISYPSVHDTAAITQLSHLLTAFTSRIPSFVWTDLGTKPPLPSS